MTSVDDYFKNLNKSGSTKSASGGSSVDDYFKPFLQPIQPVAPQKNLLQNTASNFGALAGDELSFGDVAREVPGVVTRGVSGLANTFVPALTKFFKTTGGIIGEGVAYAVDPIVREEYSKGNLDVLPNITNTTQAELFKTTAAAGIETAVYRSFPNIVKLRLAQRGGAGAIQGIGFAISEGLANDKSPEDIIKELPTYGIAGGAIGVISPYLLPLLKAEIKVLPNEIRNAFKGIGREVQQRGALTAGTRKLSVDIPTGEVPVGIKTTASGGRKLPVTGTAESTRVPISTPKTKYEDYRKSQGYEPIVPDAQLPVIEYGTTPKSKLPTISQETPLQVVQEAVSKRIARLSPKDKGELLTKTRRLFGNGMEYKAAQETALLRMEGRIKGADDVTFVPERVVSESPTTKPVEKKKTPTQEPVATKTSQASLEDVVPVTKSEKRVTSVPAENLPVGSGDVRVSRLEARTRGVVNNINPSRAEAEGISTYKAMKKPEQIRMATKFVTDNPDDVMPVLRGEKPVPEGMLYNSIAIAAEQKAEQQFALKGDVSLALKLSSLRSTRGGQEISILTEADPSNPISKMNEVIVARSLRALRKAGIKVDATKGNEAVARAKKLTSKHAEEGSRQLKKTEMKIVEAESLLNSIIC